MVADLTPVCHRAGDSQGEKVRELGVIPVGRCPLVLVPHFSRCERL